MTTLPLMKGPSVLLPGGRILINHSGAGIPPEIGYLYAHARDWGVRGRVEAVIHNSGKTSLRILGLASGRISSANETSCYFVADRVFPPPDELKARLAQYFNTYAPLSLSASIRSARLVLSCLRDNSPLAPFLFMRLIFRNAPTEQQQFLDTAAISRNGKLELMLSQLLKNIPRPQSLSLTPTGNSHTPWLDSIPGPQELERLSRSAALSPKPIEIEYGRPDTIACGESGCGNVEIDRYGLSTKEHAFCSVCDGITKTAVLTVRGEDLQRRSPPPSTLKGIEFKFFKGADDKHVLQVWRKNPKSGYSRLGECVLQSGNVSTTAEQVRKHIEFALRNPEPTPMLDLNSTLPARLNVPRALKECPGLSELISSNRAHLRAHNRVVRAQK